MATLIALSTAAFVARRPIDESMNSRAAEREYLRYLAGVVTEYGREYHRPAFTLDSVVAHLDSTRAAEFRSYMIDLWGHRIGYQWAESTFTLSSGADRSGGMTASERTTWSRLHCGSGSRNPHRAECFAIFVAANRRREVIEDYWWPPDVLNSGRMVYGAWTPYQPQR